MEENAPSMKNIYPCSPQTKNLNKMSQILLKQVKMTQENVKKTKRRKDMHCMQIL